ncbi:MAG TPA: HAD family hydrolase [Desulfomonilia bacterium]|nr:HAD family hydrolase [Desulfomonilia bacterium]
MKSSTWQGTAVFFDRDGTLIRDKGYLSDPDGIDILPGAIEAVRSLNNAGIKVIIVTNQSGIARGYFSEVTLHAIHDRLMALFAGQGAGIDAVYYCPHHPEGIVDAYRKTCSCRKPEPGLLLKAAEEFGLDLKRCYLVGDKPIDDIETIHRVGGKGILISTDDETGVKSNTDYITHDICDAVHWICGDMAG